MHLQIPSTVLLILMLASCTLATGSKSKNVKQRPTSHDRHRASLRDSITKGRDTRSNKDAKLISSDDPEKIAKGKEKVSGKHAASEYIGKNPHYNPSAKDPKAPIGSQSNPAAIHYDPKKQSFQTAIIASKDDLRKPQEVPQGAYGARVRRARYKEHGDAMPGWGKEDQPPASVSEKKPDDQLYNVPKYENNVQGSAVKGAKDVAKQGEGYVQQVIYEGGPSQPVLPLPKKPKSRRWLVPRATISDLLGDHLERRASLIDDGDMLDAWGTLYERAWFEEDDLLTGLYVREALLDPETWL